MLEGVNGPPVVPVDVSPSAGATVSVPEVALTVRLTKRVVVPFPFVALVNVTMSLCAPAASAFARSLMVTVTEAEAPGSREPPAAESVSHACVAAAVHVSDVDPVFCSE
jgi:hypothetical protein